MMHNQPDTHLAALTSWLTGRFSEVVRCSENPAWNWDRFVALASGSGVLCALYSESLPASLTARIPPEVHNLIRLAQTLNADRNRVAFNQLAELSSALNNLSVHPIVLKGLANLLAGIYPNLGCRYLADIDLLIAPPADFASSVAILQNLGYSPQALHPVEFNIGHTYPPLTRPDSLEIDVHRVLGLGPSASFLSSSELENYAVPQTLNGARLRTPSPTHLVVHHILHSQLHDVYRERISPSLRNLYDLFLLIQHFGNAIDWPAIEALFRRRGQYAVFALYLLHARDTFGIQSPLPLHLTGYLRLRRARRLWFQRHPPLRFFDPFFYCFAIVQPRTRRLSEILSHPGGIRYLLGKFVSPRFYARLRAEFRS